MRLALSAIAVAIAVVAVPIAQAAKVVPRKAVPGATVELRGDDIPKTGKVKVAGERAEIVSRAGSKVRFVVPKVKAGPRSVRMGDAEVTMRVLERFRGRVGVELADKTGRKTIGASGGALTTTHDGITYRLEVPAGALSDEKRISMTPVAKLKNLPLTGNRPAAVRLRPNGLEFATPAELSIGGLKKPGSQVGFTMTDKGRGLELLSAARQGKRVVVSLEHFTTPGAGGPTEQDYVNIFQQFLSSTGATLTRGQVQTLLVELGLVQERFPNFCANQSVCADVVERARESLERLIDEECTRQSTQPTIGGFSIIVGLTADIQELPGNAAVPDCVVDILTALADPAIANVGTDPFGQSDAESQLSADDLQRADLDQDGMFAWIEWVFYLGGRAQAVAADDVADRLVSAFINALERTLVDGRALCDSPDPDDGRALLERGYAIALATGFMKVDYEVALAECSCPAGAAAVLATAAQACAAGDVAFLDRGGEVATTADIFFSASENASDSAEERLTDPRAPFVASLSSSSSLNGESASSTASQNSSVDLGPGSLSFSIDASFQASHSGSHSGAGGHSTGSVRFDVTSAVPYTVSGSIVDDGPGHITVYLDGESDDEPNVIDFASNGSTTVGYSGELAPGRYIFFSGLYASSGDGSGSGALDLTFTVG